MAPSELERVRARLGDRYHLERELGRGGMGTVYLARDLRLDRAVALKVLPPEYATDLPLRERFVRETRTAAGFSHPNIVPVHAVEESGDILAYAMGYVEGESLTERVQRAGPLGLRDLVRLLQDVGYALAYAHGRGVVHRDLKPDNVMIERATGRALLTDFGIARPIAAADTAARPGLTRIGEVVGTPEYMSPEQATADALDGRSDLYSLGLVAHFAATGRTVMEAETPRAVMVRQLSERPTPLSVLRPDLPPALTAAVDRCVMKDPADRFQTAEELVDAIDEAQLAPREIPLAIRSLVPELSVMLLVVGLVTGISIFVVRDMPSFLPLFVRLLPASLFMSIGLARIWQSLSEVRRLAELGYTLDAIMQGLRGVVDEQQLVREEARHDVRVVERRRRALRTALIGLPVGVLAFYLAVSVIVPKPKADPIRDVEEMAIVAGDTVSSNAAPPAGDSARRAPPPPPPMLGNVPAPRDPFLSRPQDSLRRVGPGGPPPNEKLAALMILIAFLLIGFSLVSLSRSPFRMPIGEWVFRQLFLRMPGRMFLALGMRAADDSVLPNAGRMVTPPPAVTPARTNVVSPAPRAPSVSPPSVPVSPATLAAIESRVAALEQWRAAQSRTNGSG